MARPTRTARGHGRRTATLRRLAALGLGVVVVSLAACGGDGDGVAAAPTRADASSGTTATTGPSRTSAPPASTTPPAAAPDVETPSLAPADPSAIVGRWSSIGQGRAQSVYEFRADGSFTSVVVNLQLLASGTTRLTLRAEGTYTTDAGSVAFAPTSATRTFQNPGDPAQDYTDQPYELAAWSGQWSIDGQGRLLLTDVGGELRTYVPIP